MGGFCGKTVELMKNRYNVEQIIKFLGQIERGALKISLRGWINPS
jgi:hypothetical protein